MPSHRQVIPALTLLAQKLNGNILRAVVDPHREIGMAAKLMILSETSRKAYYRPLERLFDLHFLDIAHIGGTEPEQYLLVDLDLRNRAHMLEVGIWLRRRPKHGKVIFAVDPNASLHLQETQAIALGATTVVHRPLDPDELVKQLWADFDLLSADNPNDPIHGFPAVGPTVKALQQVFSFAYTGEPLDSAAINSASDVLALQIEAEGLGAWVATVRRHHSQTYQHSLIVTGLIVAFAQHLGASPADVKRLATGGMLHDIGKAYVPVGILEKPGP